MKKRQAPLEDDRLASLQALGFNGLESQVYLELLRLSPQSGYGIAKNIGKAGANTYQALESLEKRSVVAASDGEPRLYRAVAPSIALRRISSEFNESVQTALRVLPNEAPSAPVDPNVYRLKRTDAALERARFILRRASSIALVDAFPQPLELLEKDIQAARERGVTVQIKAYTQPSTVTQAVTPPNAKSVLEKWPVEWLIVVADGSMLLLAMFDDEMNELKEGIFSDSPFIAWVFHSALCSEMRIAALEQKAQNDYGLLLSRALADTEGLETHPDLNAEGLLKSLARPTRKSR